MASTPIVTLPDADRPAALWSRPAPTQPDAPDASTSSDEPERASVTPSDRTMGVGLEPTMTWRRAVTSAATVVIAITGCQTDSPSGEPAAMVLPLRWCALEGSSVTQGATSGLVSVHPDLFSTSLAAGEIWAQARIAFFAQVVTVGEKKGVPVVEDPDEFLAPGESAGDIDAPGGDTFEAVQAAEACRQRWIDLEPTADGPVVVVARQFLNSGLTLAASASRPFDMRKDRPRWVDLCADPRSLRPTDVFDLGPHTSSDRGYVVMQDVRRFTGPEERARSLAHELGHVILLGHGDGVDNNDDGDALEADGVRRYDEYCDPLGSGEDDEADPSPSCKASLMMASSCGTKLTPLQVEQARAAAAVTPGCRGTPCARTE